VLRVNTQDSLLVTPAEFGEGDPAPPPRVLVSGNFRDPLLGVPGDPPVVDQPDGHRVEEMQLLPRVGELLGTVGPRHRSRNPQRNQHHGRAGCSTAGRTAWPPPGGPGPTGRGRTRWAIRWKPALNAFAITFEGRIAHP